MYIVQVGRPKTHGEQLGIKLLDLACEVVSAQGPHALNLRRLAADAHTSTTAVYSLFGGKAGLRRALQLEAVRRFAARLTTAQPSDDPVEDVIRFGLVYREHALADPHLYSIMFTRPVPVLELTDEDRALSVDTLRPLLESVRRGLAAGRFIATSPETTAFSCWVMAHGLVSLELNGNLPPCLDVAATYERALRAALAGWRAT